MLRRLVLSGLSGMILASAIAAQEARQQGNAAAKLTPASYTESQAWMRSAALGISSWAGFIAFAKTKGDTPDDVGRFFFAQFKAGWGPPNSGVPIRVARAFLLNYASFPNADAQLVAANDTMAVARTRRASYAALFGASGALYGTTVADYERAFTVFNQLLAGYLGIRYSERMDGDWMEWTFKGRGSAALTAFPRGGTFTATLTAEQAGGAAYAGTFEARFLSDGTLELRDARGDVKVRERYDVALDQVALHSGTGEWACPGQPVGTYRFVPQANGDIVFGRLADPCEGRVRFVGRRWVKK